MNEENKHKILYMKFCTNNSNDKTIYDYKGSTKKEIEAYILEDSYIVLIDITLNSKYEQIDINSDEELFLFRVIKDEDSYTLDNQIQKNCEYSKKNADEINNKIWYVIRPEVTNNHKKYNEDYYLNSNDMIKIGKIQYIVKEIYLKPKEELSGNSNEATYDLSDINSITSDQESNINSINNNTSNINYNDEPIIIDYNISEINNNTTVINSKMSDVCDNKPDIKYNISDINKDKDPVFNFVYKVNKNNYIKINNQTPSCSGNIPGSDDYQKSDFKCEFCPFKNNDDFLISLCKCKKYMHYKCAKAYIRNSIESNKKKNNEYVDYIVIKEFKCSECGMYPISFQLPDSDKVYDLIDYKKPTDCDYMILESLPHIISDQYYKIIYIIKLKKYITIGRNSTNDIVLEDITSSNYHAILEFNKEEGKICIKDRNSTYGTLVLVRGPIEILDKKIFLQVGCMYTEASLEDKTKYDNKDKKDENIKKGKNIFDVIKDDNKEEIKQEEEEQLGIDYQFFDEQKG